MKKTLFVAILFAAVSVSSFAFSPSESSLGLGFGWGNFFEREKSGGNTAKTYMGSPGVTLDAYQFWNGQNIGLFCNLGILFPVKLTIDINGNKTTVDLSVYHILMQENIIIGPGFRHGFNDRLTLLAGLGLDFMGTFGTFTQNTAYANNVTYTMIAINLGIGGDIGVKFDITDVVFLQVGTTIAWDPLCYTSTSSNVSSAATQSGWASQYSLFSFRPYLCVGLNMYVTEPGFFKSKLGKPR
jgi:hypothetical protein